MIGRLTLLDALAALVAYDDWLEGDGPFEPDPVADYPARPTTAAERPADQLDHPWNEPGAPFRSADY